MSDKNNKNRSSQVEPSVRDRNRVMEPKLDRNTQVRIGEALRSMYDDLLDQPVPDRLVALLKDLGTEKKDPE